jgi:signal transduction histidine kinase
MVSSQRLAGRVPPASLVAPVARSPQADTPEGGTPEGGTPEGGPPGAGIPAADLPAAGPPDADPSNAGPSSAGPPGNGSRAPRPDDPPAPSRRLRRLGLQWPHLSWVDIAWVGFVALNLAAMRLFPEWQTVPFLAIWVSLTVIYGFRLWRLQPTILTLAAVTVATGGIIGVQVLKGVQDADYLAEVPLIALMFLVMVWHGRRRLAATEERLAAMDEVQRVSQENLRLLKQQRRFLQDASHELGTPITVALGHAELIERAVTNTAVAEDAHVVTDELMRLRRLATRMLLLASAGSPDFLHLEPVPLESVAVDALDRWGHTPRRWRLTATTEATALVDRDRLALALDALVENAIAHTAADDLIELGARRENGHVIVSVGDSGCGILASDLERIFLRFARADQNRTREDSGFGLGLAIVQAIAEAHHGSARVSSTPGQGSVFEVLLPVSPDASPAVPPTPESPVTAQPVTAQPVTAQPVTAQPVTAQPVTAQPVTAQPVTSQPVTSQPSLTGTVTAQPSPGAGSAA